MHFTLFRACFTFFALFDVLVHDVALPVNLFTLSSAFSYLLR